MSLGFYRAINFVRLYPQTDIRRYLPFAVILLAYIAGMWIDVMEIDAAQYAGMSRSMMQWGDYLHLHDHGRNYLDKPPLTFWMTALSYKLLGVSTWTYKLPSVLFSLLAVWGTERLASLLHNRRTGELAALIFASAQGVFLMNNDVKTDMYMIAPMILATWLLVKWLRGGRMLDFVLGSMLVGVGMLAKGPLAVVAPGLAIGADILLRRDWRSIFRWQWLLFFPLVVLVTLPWDIGQYQQYGWEGVRFFFWTQSFGRVTGESEWQNDATAFFFVHTFAWAFLPWALMVVWALVGKSIGIVTARFKLPKQDEAIAIGGFVLIFGVLSLSRFKLPHYIFVTFPFAAILLADFWVDAADRNILQGWRRFFLRFHLVIWILAVIFTAVLAFWAFPEAVIWPKLIFLALSVLLGIDLLRSKTEWQRLVWPTALGFALCNLLLNSAIYPEIMRYQSTAMAGKYFAAQGYRDDIHAFLRSGRALDFYAGKEVLPIPGLYDFTELLAQDRLILYTNAEGLGAIRDQGITVEILQTYAQHAPSKLSIAFILPATRASTTSPTYLLHLPKQAVQAPQAHPPREK